MIRTITFKSNYNTLLSVQIEEKDVFKAIHRAYGYMYDILTTSFSCNKDEVFFFHNMEIVSRGTINSKNIEKVKNYERSLLEIIELWKKENE